MEKVAVTIKSKKIKYSRGLKEDTLGDGDRCIEPTMVCGWSKDIRQSSFMLQVLNEYKVRSGVTLGEALNCLSPGQSK